MICVEGESNTQIVLILIVVPFMVCHEPFPYDQEKALPYANIVCLPLFKNAAADDFYYYY